MAHDRPVPAAEPDDDGTPAAYGVPKLRRQILQRLADAFADDNLELAEYERRVRGAEHATTIAQLEALVADFPNGSRPPPSTPPPSLNWRRWWPTSRMAGRPPPSEPPGTLVAGRGAAVTVMGERDLAVQAVQDLPRQVINVMGATRIDLSDAPPGVYELRVYNVMGELQVAVPYGTQVNRTLWSLLSDVSVRPWKVKRTMRSRFSSRGRGAVQPVRQGAHQVTLAGVSLMGEVTIREESP